MSVLKQQQDASAVIVSFGVLDDEILGIITEGVMRLFGRGSDVCSRYAKELAHEIKRVMNPFGLIVGTSAAKYMGEPDVPAIRSDPRYGGVYFRK